MRFRPVFELDESVTHVIVQVQIIASSQRIAIIDISIEVNCNAFEREASIQRNSTSKVDVMRSVVFVQSLDWIDSQFLKHLTGSCGANHAGFCVQQIF
jgi:hypothetical protein